ncbi:MAG: tetratricopeptide repeat protein [Bacteroidetes bacterium]|nr:tetratricopeptide repeat protein [Bacteroidota bacterium]
MHTSQFVIENEGNIAVLLQHAYNIRGNDLKQSIQIAEDALTRSRISKDIELQAKCLSHLSLFYMIKGEYPRSIAMAEEGLVYFKELKDEKGIADVKYNIAGVYYKTDNFHLGLVNLIDCLGTYKKLNDFHNQSRVQKSLGTIYEYFGDQKNAIRAYESAIVAAQAAGDIGLESNAYNPLSGIYLKQDRIDEAREIIERAIAMKEQAGDVRGLAFSLYGRAKVYTAMGRFEEAEADLEKALEIHDEAGERLGTAMAYRKLGVLYQQAGRLQEAKIAFEKALEVSDEYNIAITRFRSHYHLYEVYKLEQKPEQALRFLEEYIRYKEAVINAQTLQVIENYELITRMETMEKEAQMQKEKAEIIEKKNIAEQAWKVRQEFLSTMSHEIRTPLNAVITISSLIKGSPEEEERHLLSSLRLAANNLLYIINDILDFTKLDSGKASLELRPGNLMQLLENIKSTYESMAQEKGLELKLNVAPSVAVYYELDEAKLSQILGNLISNAIKFTDAGRIGLEVEKTGDEGDYTVLRFRITDTGVGIPENRLSELFKSFSQIHSITTRKQGGSGLGLAIVKKLVELHGSKVQVTSIPGEGSIFTFDIKLKRSGIVYEAPERDLSKLKDKTVLLAEDNMVNAMVAGKLLSNWGLITTHAKNGLEAVEMSKQRKYDFILMDIHMPEMNGFDATKIIRQPDNLNSHTPVFALTADITADQDEEYKSFFNGFLKKPIERDNLYDALV